MKMISELFDEYQLTTIITPTISIEVCIFIKFFRITRILCTNTSQLNTSLLLPIGLQLIGNHCKDHEVIR